MSHIITFKTREYVFHHVARDRGVWGSGRVTAKDPEDAAVIVLSERPEINTMDVRICLPTKPFNGTCFHLHRMENDRTKLVVTKIKED